MTVSSLFLTLFNFLLPPAGLSLIWLYFYATINGCTFPEALPAQGACLVPGSQKAAVKGELAPFRLLVLADPQLEGDTSLPDPNAPNFPSLLQWRSTGREHGLGAALEGAWPMVKSVVAQDLPVTFQAYRKRLDLLGNDYYLAHIYRSVKWWAAPTHTVVLGDLLGSQWIGDVEFEERAGRFWDRVFAGGRVVPEAVTGVPDRVEKLGQDAQWPSRIITVAGNHDIGYAGDIDEHRIQRFERRFGHVNWEIRFEADNTSTEVEDTLFTKRNVPELQLVMLNSMNLDQPTAHSELYDQTWRFLNASISNRAARANPNAATVLLTHIPLHKAAGLCTDNPHIEVFPPEYGGGIREQNHLRPETSTHILDTLPSQSIILNGHDHAGCDVLHWRNDITKNATVLQDETWKAVKLWSARLQRGKYRLDSVREITVRSMMGSYGGNAGFLSAWFDDANRRWHFEYNSCRLGVQHYWWIAHVLALIEVGLLFVGVAAIAVERTFRVSRKQKTD